MPCARRLVLCAETFAIASSGIVNVQEYVSSSAPSARSVSTQITSLLDQRCSLSPDGLHGGA
jgi:hypothetical protein